MQLAPLYLPTEKTVIWVHPPAAAKMRPTAEQLHTIQGIDREHRVQSGGIAYATTCIWVCDLC